MVPTDIKAEDEETVHTSIRAAIYSGYTHIDTGFQYQQKKFIGDAISALLKEGEIGRFELFITTMLPANGMQPDCVEYFMKKSLAALQTNYVDLYLVHTPISSMRSKDDDEYFVVKDDVFQADNNVDLVENWKAMEKLVDKGLTRAIGLSNYNSEQVKLIYDAARIKPAMLQVECHAYLPQFELFDFCEKLGIAMTAFAPLGTSGFAEFAKKNPGLDCPHPCLVEDERLKPIAEKYGKTPSQVLLQYLVKRGIVVIPTPKENCPHEIQDNIQIFDFSLTKEEYFEIKAMGDEKRRYMKFDHIKGMTDLHTFNILLD
ncbi:aldo-keto reductase family 1 member A1-like isoform X2 [Stegodyphus dumicola]|uniref:aldo-keto reductase family 1 member A1-like isoform X2 n=1 Tax=Stegodyphus dumicola TaxID=202533 RepID=UPI0015A774DF|nr:aldo-keto reductase family 1 member A1-like isoform X2 [Stegodyphus dumicola]